MKKKIVITCIIFLIAGIAAAVWFLGNQSATSIVRIPDHQNPPRSKATLISENDSALSTKSNIVSGVSVSKGDTYKNLQIFFLYADAEIEGERYVTLGDALKAKMVVVKETSDVNQLEVDNLSSSYVYINSGDIVRGGKQDRTIQYDVILEPEMKNVNLASFCVESGRWHERGDENSSGFSSSSNSLSSKELKVASKVSRSQQEVWSKVEEYQDKASENISFSSSKSVNVKSDLSSSSLELTLENEDLKKMKAEYKQHFLRSTSDRKNAVGFAFYINGKLSAVDIYNNRLLFDDLYDKILESAIAEAVSKKAVKYNPVSSSDVKKIIETPARKLGSEEVNKITRFISAKLPNHVMLFTTVDMSVNTWLHKNWLDTEV